MESVFYRNNPSNDNYGYIIINNEIINIKTFDESCKALHGDIILYDKMTNKIVNIKKRNKIRLLGVLAVSSKVSIGMTSKNIPKKKFIPFDKRYPPFAVPTKKPMQSTDVYAIIQFDKWDNDKYPSGNLERILGNIGDYDAEIECLKICHDVNWKKIKFNIDDYLIDLTSERCDMTNLYCFNIDPIGCKDIDDVLHFRKLDNNIIEIGIHIADVSSYIPINSELDLELKSRCESVYFENNQINMMPDILSTNYCSLLMGEKRRTFSVIIHFNNNLEKIDVKFVKGMIINKKSLTYEQVDNIIMDNSDQNINDMYTIGKYFFDKKYNNRVMLDRSKKYDSHMMVEIFMIMANVEVAEMLIKKMPDQAIIRSHKGLKLNESIIETNDTDINKLNAIKLMNTYKMERAQYMLYDNQNNSHIGLGELNYTHFTSPIRRYFDITVHRLLWNAINDKNDIYIKNLQNLCQYLNDCHKKIGNAHRESSRLHKIYNIYHDNPVIESYGYIVNINDRMITLYVPILEIDVEAKIFSDKLIHLINYTSSDDLFLMENKQTLDKFKLELLQKIDIRIIISIKKPYVRKKFVIEIINPNPILFITNGN